MKIETLKLLQDIADCCAAARRFATEKTFADYQTNDLLRSAIERKLGIIGEAFVQMEAIDPAQTEQFPELRKIVGMRNRIIHGYDRLDDQLVWDVVQKRLPALQAQVEALLPAE